MDGHTPEGAAAGREGRQGGAPSPHPVHTTVRVRVELFGMARLASGCALLELDLPCDAALTEVTQALVGACAVLRGVAIGGDGRGLLESYTLNLNGRVFVSEAGVHLQPGDRSCTSALRIIPSPPKPGKIPPFKHVLEGACHGVASFFLPIDPVPTPLALRHLAPHLVQVRRDGSGHASRVRAPHAQAPPLQRPQSL